MPLAPETIEMMINELSKKQDAMEAKFDWKIDEIKNDMKEIKDMIKEQNNVFVSRVEYQYTLDRVKSMEDNRRKIIRIIVSAVIAAVLSLIFVK